MFHNPFLHTISIESFSNISSTQRPPMQSRRLYSPSSLPAHPERTRIEVTLSCCYDATFGCATPIIAVSLMDSFGRQVGRFDDRFPAIDLADEQALGVLWCPAAKSVAHL